MDKSGKEEPGEVSEKDKKARIFLGLALPDQEWKPTNKFDGKDAATRSKSTILCHNRGMWETGVLAFVRRPETSWRIVRDNP